MAEKYANKYTTYLQGYIDSSDTEIFINIAPPVDLQVTTASGDTWMARIGEELVKVTDYDSGSAVLTITRAQEGTVAAAHDEGAAIVHILTAGSLTNIITETGFSGAMMHTPTAGTWQSDGICSVSFTEVAYDTNDYTTGTTLVAPDPDRFTFVEAGWYNFSWNVRDNNSFTEYASNVGKFEGGATIPADFIIGSVGGDMLLGQGYIMQGQGGPIYMPAGSSVGLTCYAPNADVDGGESLSDGGFFSVERVYI